MQFSHRVVGLWLVASAVFQPVNVMAAEADAWRDQAAALVPPAFVAGQVYRVDYTTMTGTLAAFPVGSDSVDTPGSAFDPGYAVTVKLRQNGAKVVFVSGIFGPRNANDRSSDPNEDYFAEQRADIAATAKDLPAGTEPCRIYGWAADKDGKRLDIRTAPSDDAGILATLPPPFVDPREEAAPEEGLHAEFSVVGYKAGWFLIDDIKDPRAVYGALPEDTKPAVSARGWVKTSEVMAAYANSQMPVGWLLQAPNVDAKANIPEGAAEDARLSIDGTLEKLLACSANWALTQSTEGKRGWWRGICSNQVTNCS